MSIIKSVGGGGGGDEAAGVGELLTWKCFAGFGMQLPELGYMEPAYKRQIRQHIE